ncbi:MAG: fibrobacter succinogenes major paralogous domain-containing protein [Bacteroidetes bacterium]|nr:fibrobacter succinogenes major paralogous domain-containing protein [Bacteroidota bacterium]
MEQLTTGAYCYYDNNYSNNAIYGKLYNWYAVGTGKLVPKGWHVPTDAEWETLITYLGGEDIAGRKMKSTKGWETSGDENDSSGFNGNNSSGFTGLPAGYRSNYNGSTILRLQFLLVFYGEQSQLFMETQSVLRYFKCL